MSKRFQQQPTAPRGRIPTPESDEDDFFARGEVNTSFPPAAMDVTAAHELEDLPESRFLTSPELERRERLRRIVGIVVGAAAVLTAVVGAKALSTPATSGTASDGSFNVPQQVVPSIALAPAEEPAAAKTTESDKITAADPVALHTAPMGESAPALSTGTVAEPQGQVARRLPVIDIEVPASTDPAIDQKWELAAKNLASRDFKGADSAFAELGKRTDSATRESARLARAAWWMANGRQNEVKPVIADLAANATTPSVRRQARDLLRAN